MLVPLKSWTDIFMFLFERPQYADRCISVVKISVDWYRDRRIKLLWNKRAELSELSQKFHSGQAVYLDKAAVCSYSSAQRKLVLVPSQSLGVGGMANSKIHLPSRPLVFISS